MPSAEAITTCGSLCRRMMIEAYDAENMNKNEKKLVLTLAKSLVHQLDVNMRLIQMLPDDKAAEIQPHQDQIESELDSFIKLVKEEWKFDDQA